MYNNNIIIVWVISSWLTPPPPNTQHTNTHTFLSGSVSKVSQSLLQDLMQLQALLCCSEGVEVTGHLEMVMEEAGLKMKVGALSLSSSFPHTGKIKQVSLKNSVMNIPAILLKMIEFNFFQGQNV